MCRRCSRALEGRPRETACQATCARTWRAYATPCTPHLASRWAGTDWHRCRSDLLNAARGALRRPGRRQGCDTPKSAPAVSWIQHLVNACRPFVQLRQGVWLCSSSNAALSLKPCCTARPSPPPSELCRRRQAVQPQHTDDVHDAVRSPEDQEPAPELCVLRRHGPFSGRRFSPQHNPVRAPRHGGQLAVLQSVEERTNARFPVGGRKAAARTAERAACTRGACWLQAGARLNRPALTGSASCSILATPLRAGKLPLRRRRWRVSCAHLTTKRASWLAHGTVSCMGVRLGRCVPAMRVPAQNSRDQLQPPAANEGPCQRRRSV